MKAFKFKISHDNGKFNTTVFADNQETAINQVLIAENCPLSALQLISETEVMYKVVKLFRVSGRRQVIERYLTESEAQRLVKSYPYSSRSMVVYFKQFSY